MRSTRTWALAALTGAISAVLLSGCGGGGDAKPLAKITAVKVMGDSLADVGTFGLKFTVQGTATEAVSVFPEIVARSYGLAQHCNFYAFDGVTFTANTAKTGCTNFAIGGGRINGAGARGGLGLEGGAADPRIVGVQLATAVAAGNHTANDLLLIDGGGNDVADMVGLYLGTAAGTPAAVAAYNTVLKTVLPAATVDSTMFTAAGAPSPAGFAQVGGLYMAALADKFYDQIQTLALDKGAKQVALINLPAVVLTPRLQEVLAGVAAASGGGTAGATAAQTAATLFDNWIKAFNTQLATRAKGNASVAIVDLYGLMSDFVARPRVYGFTNLTTPACPAGARGTDGLLTYSFLACTVVSLNSSTPPAGSDGTPSWWRGYLFSDSFHPTPLGHEQAAVLIRTVLFNNSWQ